MGKKLDALLGRGFKTSQFKATVALAVTRAAVLKNQHQARCSIARSDVVELLKGSHHERALLRVEKVIKEQNMSDVLAVLEGYCHLLVERVSLIEQDKLVFLLPESCNFSWVGKGIGYTELFVDDFCRLCPEELKEAMSSLIYASTRCGEFPELQEIRAIFTSRYGKEFAAQAVELRNNCGVNPKIIQKLSTRMPSLENKLKVLREIAADNSIDLPMEETLSDMTMDSSQEKKRPYSSSEPGVSSNQSGDRPSQPEEMEQGEEFSDSVKTRQYKDVVDAAEAAFKSAAYAAAAAKAAVELSRSEPTDPDDPRSPNLRPRKALAINDLTKGGVASSQFVKAAEGMEQLKPEESGTKLKYSGSTSSSDSLDEHNNIEGLRMLPDEECRNNKKVTVFDESDGEDNEQKNCLPRSYDSDANKKNHSRPQDGLKMDSPPRNSVAHNVAEEKDQGIEPLNIYRRPISVRTRQGRGW